MKANTQNLYLIPDCLRSRFGRAAVALMIGAFLALGFHLATASPVLATEEDEATTSSEETNSEEVAPAADTESTDDGKIDSPVRESLQDGACLRFDDNGKCDVSEGSEQISNALETILNIFSVAIGAASVIMILYGSFRYVVSGGDEKGVKSARSTIVYAVVGLVLALLAQAIVFLVLDKL